MKKRFVLSAQAAFSYLKNKYSRGEILYPRTENDYHPGEIVHFYAHPKLSEIDEFATPLKLDKYPLSDSTLTLHLSNRKIVTASLSVRMAVFVSKLYDERLMPLPGREREIQNILESHQKTIEAFLSKGRVMPLMENGNFDIPMISHGGDAAQLRMPCYFFRFPVPGRKRSRPHGDKAKQKKTSSVRRSEKIENFPNAKDRVILFDGFSSLVEEAIPVIIGKRLYFKQKMIGVKVRVLSQMSFVSEKDKKDEEGRKRSEFNMAVDAVREIQSVSPGPGQR